MKALLLSLCLIAPLFSQADEGAIAAKRRTCLHRASTTNEMRQCEYIAFREASAEMKAVQAELVRSLRHSGTDSTEIEKRLKASTKAWGHARDTQCQLKSAELLNGSEESLLLASCSVNMTLERIKELRATKF